MRRRSAVIFFIPLGLLVLAGCTANVEPSPFARFGGLSRALRLTITWPQLSSGATRAITAPTAARSIQATLRRIDTGETVATFTRDRRQGSIDEYTDTSEEATVPTDIRNAEYDLVVNYYAGTGGEQGGSLLVGTSTARVRVIPDGNGLADITPGSEFNANVAAAFQSAITVEVDPGQEVRIDEQDHLLTFTARNAAGEAITIDRGSVLFAKQPGTDAILVFRPDPNNPDAPPNGSVRGVSPGTVSVTASVNGVTSAPVSVRVTTGVGGTDLTIR